VSPYSYYAFTYLQANKQTLESFGVEIEYVSAPTVKFVDSVLTRDRFIPVFLGGINVGSGSSSAPIMIINIYHTIAHSPNQY
jgi:hypothetical protein